MFSILSERSLRLLMRSVALCATVAVIAAAAALLLALLTGARLRRTLLTGFPLLLLIPACIGTQGWIFLFDSLKIPFFGTFASVWSAVFYYFPLAFTIVAYGFSCLDGDESGAAAVFMPPVRRFFRVTLPQAKHLLITAALLVFLLFINDFSIPSVFNVNVYSLDIYAQFHVGNGTGETLAYAWPLLAVTAAAAAAGFYSFRKTVLIQKNIAEVAGAAGKSKKNFVILPVCLLLLLPLLALALQLPAAGKFFGVAKDSAGEIADTVIIGGLAALMALPPSAFLSYWLTKRPGVFSYGLLALPLALPAPVVGVLFIGAFIHTPVYATVFLTAAGLAFRFVPVAAAVMFFLLKSRDPEAASARRVFQRSRLSGFLRVTLPSSALPLLIGAGSVFILAAGEVAVSLLLIPPGYSTLSIKAYNLLHYGASDLVASTCFILLSVALVILLAGSFICKLLARRFDRA